MRLTIQLEVTYEANEALDTRRLQEEVKRKIMHEIHQGMLTDYNGDAVVDEVVLTLSTE